MAIAYEPERWHEFFVVLSSSAAVLVGLLFVVLTIHLQDLRLNRDFRMRARNNAYHLLNVFIVATLALAPQPAEALGCEAALISAYGLRLPIGITWNYYHQDEAVRGRHPFWTGIVVAIFAIYSLGAVGGVALLAGFKWGLPAIATACLALLVRSVLTAWALMFGLERIEGTKR